MKAAAIDRFGPPSALTLHDVRGRRGTRALSRLHAAKGRVVYPNGVEPVPMERRTFRVRAFDAVANPREFDKLNRHLGNGKIRVFAASYPLGKAAQAHRRLDREHVLGRMVLQVRRDLGERRGRP